jgi:D-sedoheptulose 7-phosphate isomerase
MHQMNPQKISERIELLKKLHGHPLVSRAVEIIEGAIRQGNKILLFGNGGSSTQSSHFAAELINKFYIQRRALPAISLSSDMANMSAIANDDAFEHVFSRQIEALGAAGDVAIGLTTSGTSANVLTGLSRAKEKRLATIALCGRIDAPIQKTGVDLILKIESDDTPIVQEMHLFILHTLAELLEQNIFGGIHSEEKPEG